MAIKPESQIVKGTNHEVDPLKPYNSPQLTILGDLRSVTLGGSSGVGDGSGGYGVLAPPTPGSGF